MAKKMIIKSGSSLRILDNLDLVFNCKCSFNRLGVSHTSVVGITLFTISDNKNRFMLYRIDWL